MAFDKAQLESDLKDIETYLGYLRGNENAWQYLRDVQKSWMEKQADGPITVVRLDPEYHFPCPEARYHVNPYNTMWIDIYLEIGTTFDRDPYVKALQASASMAWEDGQAWARGVADYWRSVCDQFTRPDVKDLKAAVEGMHTDVLEEMVLNQANDNWAALGNLPSRWTGDSAVAFSNFYDNYNDVHARIGRYLQHANVGFAVAAKIINGTQLAAQTTISETVETLKEQLSNWATHDMQPPGGGSMPAWVGNTADVIKSALALGGQFPIVGEIVKTPNKIAGIPEKITALLEDIEKASGKDIMDEVTSQIEPKTAEEVYSSLTTSLNDQYLTTYVDSMQTLGGGARAGFDSGELIDAFNRLGPLDWTLPPVSDESMRDPSDTL